MSGKDRQAWKAMLDADPALQAAWDAYIAQLDKDAALIEGGIRPTGQALSEAARRVVDAAGDNPKMPAND